MSLTLSVRGVRREESHKILSGILKDTHEKHARGELDHLKPTPEEEEAVSQLFPSPSGTRCRVLMVLYVSQNRLHHALMEQEHGYNEDDQVDAVGMIDALGNQMHDNKYDLQHRLESFFEMDKNKDAFLTEVLCYIISICPHNMAQERYTHIL